MSNPIVTEVGTDEAVKILTRAAVRLRAGASIPPEQMHLLADMLRAEAILLGEIEPYLDIINVGIKQAGGGHAALRLAKNEETGDIKFFGDNIPNAIRLAQAIINHEEN